MRIYAGLRVVEVASYAYVPVAGAVMADWGAEVLKIEHPTDGDPTRGTTAYGVAPGDGGVSFLWETFNRGKKSLAIDLVHEDGRELLLKLVETADVFLTNMLPGPRSRLGIDVDDVKARNPKIIYVRGSGHGPIGPERERAGFDSVSYWARSGIASLAAPEGYGRPIDLPAPGYGDTQAGLNLAGGIAAALYHRERTGESLVVDGSLLASGYWPMQAALAGAHAAASPEVRHHDRHRPGNPLANIYRTSDGRFIRLGMQKADRDWPGLCAALGRPELAEDPRFSLRISARAHIEEWVEALDEVFAERTLDEWKVALGTQDGAWAVVVRSDEAVHDEQANANGYVSWQVHENGATLPIVPPPTQFNGAHVEVGLAPDHGEHTDETLLGLGLTWDDLIALKLAGAIL